MEILLWWLPPAVVTAVAMLWVGWLGRARDLSPDRSEAAQERFAAAILRELPSQVTARVSAPRPGASAAPASPYAPRRCPTSSTADAPPLRLTETSQRTCHRASTVLLCAGERVTP